MFQANEEFRDYIFNAVGDSHLNKSMSIRNPIGRLSLQYLAYFEWFDIFEIPILHYALRYWKLNQFSLSAEH